MSPRLAGSWDTPEKRSIVTKKRQKREESLIDRSRKQPNLANRVDPTIEKRVVEYAIEYPAYGQLRTSNELRKEGVFVSASGVRSIWMRHQLANKRQRLTALEKKMAETGLVLTEAQLVALEKEDS